MADFKDWNDAHLAGYSAKEHADRGWAKPEPESSNGSNEHKNSCRRIPLLPFDDIEVGSDPEYVIDGLIPSEGLTVIWGPPKSHKSFWTFDAAMHVALGWEYRGRHVQQGTVVYCAFEGQQGFKKRIAAFRQRFLKDHVEPVPFYLQPLRLDLIKDVYLLVEEVEDQLGDNRPRLIVLDTLNRSLTGSESKDEDMSAYIGAADMLRQRFKCSVAIVHHCGVEGTRPRGHTSLGGATDAQLAVRRAGRTSTLTVEFMKDGEEGDVLHSQLEVVEVGVNKYGEPITSCVVIAIEGAVKAQAKRPRLSANMQITIDALTEALTGDGKVPPAYAHIPGNTPTVTESLWQRYALARGIGSKKDGEQAKPKVQNQTFRRAAADLQSKGYVGRWNEECWLI